MLEKYTFVKTDYPTKSIREAIQPTRGRNPDGTPKVMNHTNDEMVDRLEDVCKNIELDKRYFDAFRNLDRAVFIDWDNVPQKHKEKVFTPYTFLACIFGEGQTVPAANLILSSLVNLDLQPGQNILEIGAGSGYYACLAAKVIGDNSHVYSTEIIPSLVERAKKAVERSSLSDKVDILQADPNILGAPQYGPYDRMITTVAASNDKHISQLLEQLNDGGLLQINIIASKHKDEIKPWRPGKKITKEDIIISDHSKDLVYVIPYNF